MLGLSIVQNVTALAIGVGDTTERFLVALFFLLISFIPVYFRLKNTGMNPWICVLMVVPIANLLVAIRCLVLPEGYADTKKLDTAGKVIVGIVVGLLLIGIVIAIAGLMVMP